MIPAISPGASRHLILVGGGHAHLYSLLNLRMFIDHGFSVTLVAPDRFHYYSGMGPGMLGGSYEPEDIRIDVQRLVEISGGRCIISPAAGLDPDGRLLRLANGDCLEYDAISFNAGSVVSAETWQHKPGLVPVKPISNLVAARQEIIQRSANSMTIVVIGGGAAGVELAGNARRLMNSRGMEGEITLISSSALLPGLPARARELALDSFHSRKIAVLENHSVSAIEGNRCQLSNGAEIVFDLAFLSTGVKPNPLMTALGLPIAPDGALLVNDSLQSTGSPAVFGGGDGIAMDAAPLPRVGVHAVRQGPVLANNLLAYLDGRSLQAYHPQSRFLQLLNLGDDTALFIRNGVVLRNRAAFQLKDWIDRRFVRKFQR